MEGFFLTGFRFNFVSRLSQTEETKVDETDTERSAVTTKTVV